MWEPLKAGSSNDQKSAWEHYDVPATVHVVQMYSQWTLKLFQEALYIDL